MKRFYLILATIIVGVGVALTYFVFEAAVRVAIDIIWKDIFNTDTQRLLVVPLCLALSLIYFGVQHYLDPKKEHVKQHGLTDAVDPTVKNYLKILAIGFLSLLAGASLGPEAILVPSCMIVGAYAGVKLFASDKQSVKVLSAAGLIALFAAFFNSFIVGLLSLYLVLKESKTKLSLPLLIVAIVASASSVATLALVEGHGLIEFQAIEWNISLMAALSIILLFFMGIGATFLIKLFHNGVEFLYLPYLKSHPWWMNAAVAAAGLSIIYIVGGPLIEFTGNESIQPLIVESSALGIVGLLLIIVTKIGAIAWSKAIGYRGGLIFPSLFVISGMVLLVDQFIVTNYIFAFVAALVGMLIADRKAKILL